MGHKPHPKQQQFLLHADTREVFYGGAGGGGKSQALWYGALQYVSVPGYAALILRRTYADLAKPGALMDRAKAYLSGTAAVWNERDKQWTFPSGAKIAFGYLEHEADKLQFKSAEYQYIAFDELTDFTETQYIFLFTRLRKKSIGGLAEVPLRMRSASNPGGPGHGWVKKRFVDPMTRESKRVFIPALMDDNPSLDKSGYKESLQNTDPLTRAQIKAGDWDAIEGGLFKKEWFRFYRRDPSSPDFVILETGERVKPWERPRYQTCDPAASTSNAADHFVLSTWCLSSKANVLWLACERGKWEITEQVELCQRSYQRRRPLFVAVEEVLNQRALAQLLRRSTNPAMVVRGVTPAGRKKRERAIGWMNLLHSGRVFLPEDEPTFPLEDVIAEHVVFTGSDTDKDDIIDTGSYMAELLPQLSSNGPGIPGHVGGGGPFDSLTPFSRRR